MTDTVAGPYLQVAVFCEKVLQEKDGVLSIIRVIDQVNIQASGPAPPAGTINIAAVISLKAGMLKGHSEVKVIPYAPSGKKMREYTMGVYFEGDDRGTNLVFNISLHAKEAGVFWFDVLVHDQLLTRMPLRVVYQRLTQSGPQDQ